MKTRIREFLLFCLITRMFAPSSSAQAVDITPTFTHRSPVTGLPANSAQQPTATDIPSHLIPIITNAYARGPRGRIKEIQTDSVLVVQINNMTNALAFLRANKRIVPFLDGIPIGDIEGTIPDSTSNEIVFYLKRTAVNKDAFDRLLMAEGYGTRSITLSIGVLTEGPWQTEVRNMGFKRLTRAAIVCIGICIAIYLLISFIIAFKSNFLRDPIPKGSPLSALPPPFSLVKVQFFLWFSAIFSAFILIYAATGEFNSIPNSMFALLGVSGATTGIAFIQDRFKDPSLGLPANAGPIRPVTNAFKGGGWRKGGFLWDLISNADGLNWNRTQMLFVTIILFVIFLTSVLRNLTIPAFSSELVAMMGVSAGTFLLGLSSESHSSQQ